MKFTAIDFETANSSRASACSVGMVFVDDGKIVGGLHRLIRPEPLLFDPFNVSIHGITEADVSNAPTFAELWPSLAAGITGPMVAHNASFDMSVIRQSLDRAGMAYPLMDYFCSRIMAKIAWNNLPTYSLGYIAGILGISFEHHNAEEDARTCAMVAIHSCKQKGVARLYDLQSFGLRVGTLFDGGHVACGGPKRARIENSTCHKLCAADIIPRKEQENADHSFSGMSFVFTGAMMSMQRREAMQAIVDRGGECHDTVRQDTNFLVIGEKGYAGYCSGHKSAKTNKAESLLAQGYPIEILSESDFTKMI